MHGNRTRMRQELEKQRLELERRRDEIEAQRRRDAAVVSQTASMDVPDNSMGNQVTIEVPTNVLEVRTKLAHPTNFHVSEVKKRQVNNYLSSSLSPAQQSRSAPLQNMRGLQLHPGYLGGVQQNDPMLSNTVSGGSPMRSSSSLSSNAFNPQMSPHNSTGMPSPNKGSSMPPQMSGGMGVLFGSQPTVNTVPLTPDSPTMMNVDQNPDDIQEQIIEDIMGLEEKFGDTLGLPYMEQTMITPQTLPVSSNLFDQFGGGGGGGASGVSGAVGSGGPGTVVIPQMSASCPSNMKEEQRTGEQGYLGNLDLRGGHDKERQKKNNHNMIERRRRFNINDRIKELGSLLPATEAEARQNKGTILKASVDYIRKLQRDHDRMKLVELKQRQMEDSARQMRLRIQELELTARAHQIPTPSLTPDTVKLAEAAEQALGPVTPRSKSPGSATITPVHMFGTDELSDILRNSPQMDFSKLQIKQERMESPSPSGLDQLSPMQGSGLATNAGQATPSSGCVGNLGLGGHIFSQSQSNQRIGDIFSFNLPVSSSSLQMPPQGATNATVQLFSNT